MVSRAAGASAAAAVLLFLVARRWDGRLSVLLNLIFLFVGEPNFHAVCDDADPAMATHVATLREKHAKGMAPLPTVEVDAVEELLLPRPAGSTAGAGAVPVRVYYPPPAADSVETSPLPWLLYCHGGGSALFNIPRGGRRAEPARKRP